MAMVAYGIGGLWHWWLVALVDWSLLIVE